MQQLPEHFIYQVQPDITKADAVGWVLVDKDSKLVQYPYNFPELGDDEVRIKILYTGLCQSDILHGKSKWSDCSYPACVGHEVIGKITLIGKNVTNFKVGDTAGACPQRDCCPDNDKACQRCKEKTSNQCEKNWTGLYDPFFGGYSTHIQLPARMTFPIPDGLPLDKIPPLMCAGLTVFNPLQRHGKAGYKCAVIGIGGLGHLAVQFAAKMGMEVTVFTTSQNREQEFKELGATHMAHSTDLKSLQDNERKFDIVLNTTFTSVDKVFKAYINLVRKGGVFSQVGVNNKNDVINIDLMEIVFNSVNFVGNCIGSYVQCVEMLDFCKQHSVYPIVEIFSFEEFNKAFEHLEFGRPHYRCVVNVTDWAKKNGFDK